MTAQYGDLVVWNHVTRTVLGDLPVIAHPRIVEDSDCDLPMWRSVWDSPGPWEQRWTR